MQQEQSATDHAAHIASGICLSVCIYIIVFMQIRMAKYVQQTESSADFLWQQQPLPTVNFDERQVQLAGWLKIKCGKARKLKVRRVKLE